MGSEEMSRTWTTSTDSTTSCARRPAGSTCCSPMPAAASSCRCLNITEEHCDRIFATNVKGLLFMARKALPLLRNGAS